MRESGVRERGGEREKEGCEKEREGVRELDERERGVREKEGCEREWGERERGG